MNNDSKWKWNEWYFIIKHAMKIVEDVSLWVECTFEQGVLLYRTLQYPVEVVGNTVHCYSTLSA
jgi:hypothetical protein